MNYAQFQAPPLSKFNKFIIITTGICFLSHSILKAIGAFSLLGLFGLSANGISSGFVFQLITYPFLETGPMSFIFSSLIIWFIGSELELTWGRRVYSRFLLMIVLGVGLIYSVVVFLFFFGTPISFIPLHGLSGITFSLLMAYALLYPERQMAFMMIFPMKARTFCWILAGLEAYVAVFTSIKTSWAHLFAMGLSFLIIHFQSFPVIKNFLHSNWKKKINYPKGKRHLHVVKNDEDRPPKYWQ